jgi:signal peptidase II
MRKIFLQKKQPLKNKNLGLFFCLLLFLFILDRLSKLFFINNQNFFLDLCLFKLNFALNPNIAFSLPLPTFLIFTTTLVAIFLLSYLAIKKYQKNLFFDIFIIGLIIIGAISNLIDRIKFDGVIDFIDVPYFTIFNFSDIYIVVGAVVLILLEQVASDN